MDEEERRPVFRELSVCKQAADCPYMVSYYGAFFGDVSFLRLWNWRLCVSWYTESFEDIYCRSYWLNLYI